MVKEDEEKLCFSMTFEGQAAKRFDMIMKYYGLQNNTELIRILLFEKFKQIFPKEAK